MNNQKRQNKDGLEPLKDKIYPVPFALVEINKNITIYTDISSQTYKVKEFKKSIIPDKKSSKINLNDPKYHYKLGIFFYKQNNLFAAINSFQNAIKLKANYPDAFCNLGVVFYKQGKFKKASNAFDEALKLNPNFPDAYCNLGVIHKEQGNLKKAIYSYKKALKLDPNYAEAFCNLGNALTEEGDIENAITSLKKSLNLNPNYPEAHCNMGVALKEKGKFDEAIACFQEALNLKPDHAEAHYNFSHTLLLIGSYEKGWIEYEYRSKREKNPSLPHAIAKTQRWKEGKLQKGDKLLIISEQGLGDTIQYMRYVPYIRNQGIDVTFCAQKKLHNLIKSSNIDSKPLTPKEIDSIEDREWTPLLSLPKFLGVTPDKPIISTPYISTPQKLIQKWKEILSKEKKLIIGINWQGNLEMEKRGYKGRSIPLETFSRLVDRNSISLISLQKGFGSEQLERCSFKEQFLECQKSINSTWDFMENAAIIQNCDLIITCDTSIAHLAGGMGKKVWLLLKHIPYWTWGIKSTRTFWYPSMRLFRQKEKQNWQEVMEQVSTQIYKEMGI